MKEKDVRLLIPENLDIDKIIDDNKELCFPKFNKDKLLLMLDCVIKAGIVQRKEMEEQGKIFANVSSHKLQTLIRDYSKYLKYLIDARVILSDNHFIRGKKSRGYCVNNPYAGEKLKSILLSDKKLVKAVNRVRKHSEEERKKSLADYAYLSKWWETEKLEIDVTEALKFIDEDLSLKINAINKDNSIKDKAGKITQAKVTAGDFKHLVYTLKGKTYIGFSGDGKRFYNPVTNLKKGLRKYLSYDNRPLVEVDIKNSQPFLSIALFDEDFWKPYDESIGEKLNLERISKELYSKVVDSGMLDHIITLVKSKDITHSKDHSFTNYTDKVTDGTFYEFIEKTFKIHYPDRFTDRPATKKEVMRILYMKPKDIRKEFYQPAITFKKMFPEVYALFSMIKSKEHNLLPLILQRIESFLVIDVGCKRLSKEYPDIPPFTIHDCILTTSGNEKIVDAILKEEIKNYIGHEPKTNIENYNKTIAVLV